MLHRYSSFYCTAELHLLPTAIPPINSKHLATSPPDVLEEHLSCNTITGRLVVFTIQIRTDNRENTLDQARRRLDERKVYRHAVPRRETAPVIPPKHQ